MDNKQIKVLMIVPNLRASSGVASFVMNYYRSIDHDRFVVDFATLSYRESPYFEEIEKNGSKVFVLGSLLRHPFKHFKNAKRIIKEGNYDIVHDNTLHKSIPIMGYAKRKVPVRILHSHSIKIGETGLKVKINKMLMPLLLSKANYYTACSSNAGVAMFGSRDFTVIPNIIDTDNYRFDSKLRDEVRLRENVTHNYVVGSVGRVAEAKNPVFAVEVMEEVLKRRDDIEYWWIGSGPLDGQMKQIVEEKNISDRIRLLGSRSDLNVLYQAMDLFFLPSQGEGFGLACIEAEASGLPCVISTNFPGEVNVTGSVKFVPLENEISKWADAVIESLDKNADRLEANRICRESAYSKAGSGDALSKYYEQLVVSEK